MEYNKVKQYIKGLKQIEKETNSYKIVNQYINSNSLDILNQSYNEQICLPSFLLLREININLKSSIGDNNEINQLFQQAIYYSKLFYLRLFAIAYEGKPNFKVNNQVLTEHLKYFTQQVLNKLEIVKLKIQQLNLSNIKSSPADSITNLKINKINKILHAVSSKQRAGLIEINLHSNQLFPVLIAAIPICSIIFWALGHFNVFYFSQYVIMPFYFVICGIYIIYMLVSNPKKVNIFTRDYRALLHNFNNKHIKKTFLNEQM